MAVAEASRAESNGTRAKMRDVAVDGMHVKMQRVQGPERGLAVDEDRSHDWWFVPWVRTYGLWSSGYGNGMRGG